MWAERAEPAYGMTFLGAADSESLVIADGSDERSVRLLTVDVQTAAIVHQAKVDLFDVHGPIELAGSPTGELYGFSVGNHKYPQVLLELDVRSGAVLDRLELGPGIGLASFAAGRLDEEIYTFTARLFLVDLLNGARGAHVAAEHTRKLAVADARH